jgi:hypothetical protein
MPPPVEMKMLDDGVEPNADLSIEEPCAEVSAVGVVEITELDLVAVFSAEFACGVEM